MITTGFEQFRQFILQNPHLQEELRTFADHEKFLSHVVEVGAKNGFDFTTEEVVEAMRENRRVWIERFRIKKFSRLVADSCVLARGKGLG